MVQQQNYGPTIMKYPVTTVYVYCTLYRTYCSHGRTYMHRLQDRATRSALKTGLFDKVNYHFLMGSFQSRFPQH